MGSSLSFTTGVLVPIASLSLGLWLLTRVHCVNLHKEGRLRKQLPRHVFEQQLLAQEDVAFEEEFIPAPLPNGKRIQRKSDDKLYRQIWSKKTQASPRAVIVYLHGLNSYGGRLAKDSKVLLDHDFVVVTVDQYGHGRSDGIHAYFDCVESWVEDVKTHIDQLKQREALKNIPFFLMGQSLGGSTSILYSVKYPEDIVGSVVYCPLVEISSKSKPSQLIMLIANFLRSVYPEMAIDSPTKGKGFGDDQTRLRYQEDPTIYHGPMRVGTGWSLVDACTAVTSQLKHLTLPILIFHGNADRMTDIAGSQRLYRESSSQDKQFIPIEGGNHMLFEEKREVIDLFMNQTVQWIESKLSK